MSAALDNYKTKSVWLIGRLMQHFQWQDFQAAAVCGNGYQESMLTAALENDGIVTSPTRGIGWFQWTGPRHRNFLQWCQNNKLNWKSDEANWGFLHHELTVPNLYGHLTDRMRATKTLADATELFEKGYEGAGVVQMGHRLQGAQIALDAWRMTQGHTP